MSTTFSDARLQDILIFMATVEAGSLIGGGRATGLTRSAAAKAVARLEDRLGARLLNRTTRRLSTTDEGRLFYEHGQRVAAAVEAAEASVGRRVGTPRGLLRVTMPEALGRARILPLLTRFLAAWPDVRAEVSLTDRPADIVEEGLDLAIRLGPPPPDTRLVSRVLLRFGAGLVASPTYLSTNGTPKTAEDLACHERLLFSSRGRIERWNLNGEASVPAGAGRNRLRLDSGDALRDAALAGLGIAFLPDFLVAADLVAGALTRVLPDVSRAESEAIAIYPTRRLLEPRVRHFLDLLVAELV